jgi:hypothetical protein
MTHVQYRLLFRQKNDTKDSWPEIKFVFLFKKKRRTRKTKTATIQLLGTFCRFKPVYSETSVTDESQESDDQRTEIYQTFYKVQLLSNYKIT